MRRIVPALIAITCLIGASSAREQYPGQFDHVPQATKDWFKGLKQPTQPTVSCCDVSDCGPVEFDTQDNHYRALFNGVWIDIPPEKVIYDKGNPTGSAILCANKFLKETPQEYTLIYCFVPGGGT